MSSISAFMQSVIHNYESIKGKDRELDGFLFWDIVAISASDDAQNEAYKLQIDIKRNSGNLPIGPHFHVFADPPNSKIGCGGSALLVLEELQLIYGTSLEKMHVLFIPAGGYSQRLPCHSILGKLFSYIPFYELDYQMLDIILAIYLPFLKKMNPGVFVACSDALISYYIADNENWTFAHSGFTALAHVSPVSIGVNHGVYVLENPAVKNEKTFMSQCLRVLQKPSVSEMQQKGAIMTFNDTGSTGSVFSDSVFFFDMDIAMKLIILYKSIKPLTCEISSYSDFLQPLGLLADSSYIENNMSELSTVRRKLFELLRKVPLNVIVLKDSFFYHFGTMTEYITNCFQYSSFYGNFPCSSISTDCASHAVMKGGGIVMYSLIHPGCTISKSVIIEHCEIACMTEIGENCIISNCKIIPPMSDSIVKIPSSCLLYTAAVKNDSFVTICFHIKDDIKKKCRINECGNLIYLQKKLMHVAQCIESCDLFDSTLEYVSLWDAKIFPVCDTPEKAFLCTMSIIHYLMGNTISTPVVKSSSAAFMSMRDILKYKNVKLMLLSQDKLHSSISMTSSN